MRRFVVAILSLAALIAAGDMHAQGKSSLSCRLFTRDVIESTKIDGTDKVIPASVIDMPATAKVTLGRGGHTISAKENPGLEDFQFEGLESGEYTLTIEQRNSSPVELIFDLEEGTNALLVEMNYSGGGGSPLSPGMDGASFDGDIFTLDSVDFGIQMKSPTLALLTGLPEAKVENKKLAIDIKDIGTTLMEGAILFSLGR